MGGSLWPVLRPRSDGVLGRRCTHAVDGWVWSRWRRDATQKWVKPGWTGTSAQFAEVANVRRASMQRLSSDGGLDQGWVLDPHSPFETPHSSVSFQGESWLRSRTGSSREWRAL